MRCGSDGCSNDLTNDCVIFTFDKCDGTNHSLLCCSVDCAQDVNNFLHGARLKGGRGFAETCFEYLLINQSNPDNNQIVEDPFE